MQKKTAVYRQVFLYLPLLLTTGKGANAQGNLRKNYSEAKKVVAKVGANAFPGFFATVSGDAKPATTAVRAGSAIRRLM
jgi:hypothetical protein